MGKEKFLWGASSAAPQIEGGYNCDGRTPSIWDVADVDRIKNGDNCRTACDHYHHYKEDVALMKEMGLNSYRFSISWSRIVSAPGCVNEAGIRFYQNLIDELKKADIEPIITIFHWDTPQWVQEKGGWLSGNIVKWFSEYVEIVAEKFVNQVKYWITINEPQNFIMNAYMQGIHAPFQHKYLALPKLSRNCMRAHSEAVKILRKHAKNKIMIGMSTAAGPYIPKTLEESRIDEARQKTFEDAMGVLTNSWWTDPIILGKEVKAFGVYRLSKKFAESVKQPLDFIGLNVYTALNYSPWGGDKDIDTSSMKKNSLGWVEDGRAMYWAIRLFYERYKLPIMITENGYAGNDKVSSDGKVYDKDRINYMHEYIGYMKKAMNEGYKVIGYEHWAVMDNFEWAEGYEPRFGLIYVNYKTQERILKESAKEYRRIIEEDENASSKSFFTSE